jgi:beta-lactamase class A
VFRWVIHHIKAGLRPIGTRLNTRLGGRIGAIARSLLLALILSAFILSPLASAFNLEEQSAMAAEQQSQPMAQRRSPEQALECVFTTANPADCFADSFLRQVPPEQVQSLLASLRQDLGEYRGVQPTDDPNRYRVDFERGHLLARIALNPVGQIGSLLLEPSALSPEEAIAQLQQANARTSLLILKNGEELAALNPDEPLAVGSTFKLAVLAALRQQIESGDRTWDDSVQLRPAWKSLPSGLLQDWPDGTALTLETLATLMISLSDNTATDALIHLVGRTAVEAFSPRNTPFLTTREAFALKDPENAPLLQRYREGDEAERRALLPQLESAPLPPAALFEGDPVALDVEWFFTARELCELMAALQDLPLMGVNPGVANPADWAQVTYKGGSEPGVLNLTTGLRDAAENQFCLSATWNNAEEPLDEQAWGILYDQILRGLRF